MRGIIEHFVTFFFMLMFILIGVTYIMQNIVYSNARDFHAQVIKQLEDSNYDLNYVSAVKEKSKDAGLDLQITMYTDSLGQSAAKVDLSYEYTNLFTGSKKNYRLCGYSR